MIAGTVLVRLAEITGDDRSIDCSDDLREGDLLGFAGQDIATTDAALGSDEACALEGKQDLLEVGLGQGGPCSASESNARLA